MTRIDTAVGDPPRVAYSVGRSVGNAVTRNLVRRRLRAAVRAQRPQLRGGSAYLVAARPQVATMTFREIEATLRVLLDRAAAGPATSEARR